MLGKNELEAAAKIMQAMAHPLRLGIMQCLADDELTVTELYEKLGCSQSTMSQQLRILETQGLVKARRDGTTKYCSIQNPDFLALFHCMKKHLKLYFKVQESST